MTRPWDYCVTWHLEQPLADGPDISLDPLTNDMILNHHLRSAHAEAEVDYIEHLRRVSLREAEHITGRSLLPQWWTLVMNRFPVRAVVLPKPPFLDVVTVTYVDSAGVTQTLESSPPMFRTIVPSGPKARKGALVPLEGETWPDTRSDTPDAVRIRYKAGYPLGPGEGDPAQIPEDLLQARLLAIAEYHKQRSESVHISQSTALRRARNILLQYQVREY